MGRLSRYRGRSRSAGEVSELFTTTRTKQHLAPLRPALSGSLDDGRGDNIGRLVLLLLSDRRRSGSLLRPSVNEHAERLHIPAMVRAASGPVQGIYRKIAVAE